MAKVRRRVIFNIDEETYHRGKILPHGIRTMILKPLYIRILDLVEERGSPAFGALLSGDFRIVPTERKIE